MNKKPNQQAAEKRKREEAFNAYLDASQELEPDAYVVDFNCTISPSGMPRIWIGTGERDVSEQMLTEEQIITIKKAAIATDPGKPWGDSIAFARAIESAVRAEYADVPPEKFKALYRACVMLESGFDESSSGLYEAMKAIDNGTYNPKIGGEE